MEGRNILVVKTLRLRRSISGQQLMDAVKKIAGDDYQEIVVQIIDNDIYYKVGRVSDNLSKRVAVSLAAKYGVFGLRKDRIYHSLVVMHHGWLDEYPEVNAKYTYIEAVNKAVTDFRDRLEQELQGGYRHE